MRKKSINKVAFLEFLEELLFNISVPAYLLLDNLSFHRSKEVKEFCSDNDITLLYNPIYSSQYNPVERLWSFSKRDFLRECITTKNYKKQAVILRLIKDAMYGVATCYLAKHVETCKHRM